MYLLVLSEQMRHDIIIQVHFNKIHRRASMYQFMS